MIAQKRLSKIVSEWKSLFSIVNNYYSILFKIATQDCEGVISELKKVNKNFLKHATNFERNEKDEDR
jgi:hypothetical protein